MKVFLHTVLLICAGLAAVAQQDSTTAKPDAKWGIDVSYSPMAYTESAVVGFQITWTSIKHGLSLGPHIYHQDLFQGQSDWARFGFALTYQYFPIRSNRLFSPFLFYDLNYNFTRSERQVVLSTADGSATYGATRQGNHHALAHHFGIGTRCNFYKGFFLHLSAGAGPSTYGQSVNNKSLQSAYPDTQEKENVFSHYQTAFMARIGIAYQIGAKDLKKQEKCCD